MLGASVVNLPRAVGGRGGMCQLVQSERRMAFMRTRVEGDDDVHFALVGLTLHDIRVGDVPKGEPAELPPGQEGFADGLNYFMIINPWYKVLNARGNGRGKY